MEEYSVFLQFLLLVTCQEKKKRVVWVAQCSPSFFPEHELRSGAREQKCLYIILQQWTEGHIPEPNHHT